MMTDKYYTNPNMVLKDEKLRHLIQYNQRDSIFRTGNKKLTHDGNQEL